MKEHPILFSGPMVQAILDKRKTETRRVVKPQPPADFKPHPDYTVCRPFHRVGSGCVVYGFCDARGNEYFSRHGAPGDRLWVKETWQVFDVGRMRPADVMRPLPAIPTIPLPRDIRVEYRVGAENYTGPWRSPIYMPRWASRITLEIVRVWPEPLLVIFDKDALAEGIKKFPAGYSWKASGPYYESPRKAFLALWDSLNAKRGCGVDVNPWVWVYEFREVEAEGVEGWRRRP